MTAPFMRAYTRAARQDLPSPRRVRDGRHGRVHPEPHATRRSTSGRSPRCARTRSARPATGSTAPGSRTPTWCRCARRCSTAVLGDRPNQLDRQRDDVTCHADAAARRSGDPRRRHRAGAARQRLASRCNTWRRGCAATARSAINNLMEDAATAEISRSQIWQWVHNGSRSTTASWSPRTWSAGSWPRSSPDPRGSSATRRSTRAGSTRRERIFERGRTRRRLRGLPHPPGVRRRCWPSERLERDRVRRRSRTSSTPRLAAADRGLRGGVPGRRRGRQPVHTVYVPADRYDADTVPGLGPAGAGRRWTSMRGTARTLAGALGLEPAPVADVLRPGPRQAGRANRSRTCGSTSRTATAPGPTTRRTPPPRPPRMRSPVRLPRATRRRSSGSGSRASRRRPGGAGCAHSTCSSAAARPGAAPRRLRGHAAQGHLGGPGRGDGRWSASGSSGATGCRRPAPVRDPGRDPAGDPRR